MTVEQVFVGTVAILLGLLAVIAAIHNHDWYFRLRKARWIEQRWGRTPVRIIYAVLGIALIAMGAGIAMEHWRGGIMEWWSRGMVE
jgi:hypothetical protein